MTWEVLDTGDCAPPSAQWPRSHAECCAVTHSCDIMEQHSWQWPPVGFFSEVWSQKLPCTHAHLTHPFVLKKKKKFHPTRMFHTNETLQPRRIKKEVGKEEPPEIRSSAHVSHDPPGPEDMKGRGLTSALRLLLLCSVWAMPHTRSQPPFQWITSAEQRRGVSPGAQVQF